MKYPGRINTLPEPLLLIKKDYSQGDSLAKGPFI